jgi:hypothetical protein
LPNPESAERRMEGWNPRLHELVALAALAALGCGLALAVGDFWFATIFGIATALVIVEAIRRSW